MRELVASVVLCSPVDTDKKSAVDGSETVLGCEAPGVTLLGEPWIDRRFEDRDRASWGASVVVELILRP